MHSASVDLPRWGCVVPLGHGRGFTVDIGHTWPTGHGFLRRSGARVIPDGHSVPGKHRPALSCEFDHDPPREYISAVAVVFEPHQWPATHDEHVPEPEFEWKPTPYKVRGRERILDAIPNGGESDRNTASARHWTGPASRGVPTSTASVPKTPNRCCSRSR